MVFIERKILKRNLNIDSNADVENLAFENKYSEESSDPDEKSFQ